jgi:tetratricopeptide (TPR) repeat protein
MPRTFLDVHTTAAEREAPDNNPLATAALQVAYAAVASGDYAAAERAIASILSVAMSLRQRLRVAYVRAQISAAREEEREVAIAILEEAIDLAQAADELDAFAELSFLLASQLDCLGYWDLGAEASAAALAAWQSRPASATPLDMFDITFDVDLRDRLAMELWTIGRFEDATQQVQIAYAQTPSASKPALRGAGLQWTYAVVERSRGRPERAREHVRAAFDVYAADGDCSELTRLQLLVADIALDLAAAIPPANAFESRDLALTSAGRHLVQALAETSANGDVYSHCRALMTYTRYQRLCGHNADRLAVIESVLATGRRMGNSMFLGTVYTELGDELASLSRPDAARTCYRTALDAFADARTPGYAVFAQRALARDQWG